MKTEGQESKKQSGCGGCLVLFVLCLIGGAWLGLASSPPSIARGPAPTPVIGNIAAIRVAPLPPSYKADMTTRLQRLQLAINDLGIQNSGDVVERGRRDQTSIGLFVEKTRSVGRVEDGISQMEAPRGGEALHDEILDVAWTCAAGMSYVRGYFFENKRNLTELAGVDRHLPRCVRYLPEIREKLNSSPEISLLPTVTPSPVR